MFEVILTYRPDFSEKALDRYPTYQEAQEVAWRISTGHHERVIRVWVRQVRASSLLGDASANR
jgi:hypothetical protein